LWTSQQEQEEIQNQVECEIVEAVAEQDKIGDDKKLDDKASMLFSNELVSGLSITILLYNYIYYQPSK
jgi:hypothetical protein